MATGSKGQSQSIDTVLYKGSMYNSVMAKISYIVVSKLWTIMWTVISANAGEALHLKQL